MKKSAIKPKRGKWIKRDRLFSRTEYSCSVCGRVFDSPYRFCPACGSRNARVGSDPKWVEEMEFYDVP